jgi:elongation factor 1-gamma
MDFCTTHLDLPLSNWTYQILGWMQFNKGITVKAQQDVLAALKVVDSHLLKNSFLVGSCITLADITLACSLDLGFRMVFDPAYRAKFPNVTRWFTTCVNQPEFVAIMGPVELCAKMQEAKAPAKPKQEPKKKKAKQEPKKKEAAGGDDAPKPAAKGKNPLDLLPKPKWPIDEWKRQYSNNDTPVACQWLWDNWDPEGYSWYHIKNKYAAEQSKAWMAANLVGGFQNRWECCRKYSFGVVLICGEDKAGGMEIEGYIMFRGKVVPPDWKDIPDAETYAITPCDPINDMACRKRLTAYLAWGEYGLEGDLSGPCLDGKELK